MLQALTCVNFYLIRRTFVLPASTHYSIVANHFSIYLEDWKTSCGITRVQTKAHALFVVVIG